MIFVKRVYDSSSPKDGARFLVDRFWPRGLSREALQLAGWARGAAPSDELRRWFGHSPERWEEFRQRYVLELQANPSAYEPIIAAARAGPVTLLYSARDHERNNAVALRDYLEAIVPEDPAPG